MALQNFVIWGEYLFLIIPSILLMLVVRFLRNGRPSRRVLFFLFLTPLALVILVLLIWTNPYGREISSSPPAYGMLPVLIALLVMILREPREIASLWSSHRGILVTLFVITLVLFGFLWLAEHNTFYLVVGLTAVLGTAWQVVTRAGLVALATLCVVDVALIILPSGGSFFIPALENPGWLQSGIQVIGGLMMVFGIFLAAALLYTGLRVEANIDLSQLGFRLVLVALLTGGSAYYVFWDGVWSAAHARFFEDHLPFAHFLFGLIAGVMLFLALRGWRRLAGPAFVVFLTSTTTIALILGWNVSAFKLTDTRAAQIDAAIAHYHQVNGRFPSSLGQLTPRYLLYLRPPVVVRNAGWCYQGGPDYYRLGYVSGEFTYTAASFVAETYSQAGNPPSESWNCDEWVVKLNSGGLNY
jgi:hypothetical protein